jgi:hypothetical protein
MVVYTQGAPRSVEQFNFGGAFNTELPTRPPSPTI